MKRSNEPIAWALFGAGGMLLAFVGPALVLVTGWLLPFVFAERPGDVYAAVSHWLAHPLGKLMFAAVVSLTLYHTCHRLYHGLHDLHVRLPKVLALLLFYGGATALSVVLGAWLLVL